MFMLRVKYIIYNGAKTYWSFHQFSQIKWNLKSTYANGGRAYGALFYEKWNKNIVASSFIEYVEQTSFFCSYSIYNNIESI